MASRLNIAREIVAMVLMDSDGTVIESNACNGSDPQAYSTWASGVLRRWEGVGADMGLGPVRAVLIERGWGPAMITPVGPSTILLVVGNQSCRPGHLRFEAARTREAVAEAEGDAAREIVATAPPEPVNHLDDIVRTIEEVSPIPTLPPASGEVVLTGAHTFRSVTKLLARLLQLKGVRSSRLRAHSPSSTVIDVVLEEGATLTAIDPGCLNECSVEVAEESAKRLVLRAGKSLVTTT